MRCRTVGGGVWLKRPLSGKVVAFNPVDTKKVQYPPGRHLIVRLIKYFHFKLSFKMWLSGWRFMLEHINIYVYTWTHYN